MLKERTGFLDKALLQALLWSLVFHLALFGSFRIRLNDYQESSPQMLPLDVAIDADYDATNVATAVDIQDIDNDALLTMNLDGQEYKAILLQTIPKNQHMAYAEHNTPQMPTDTLSWAPRMYPLQLKLSPQLKALGLIDDGSGLFRKKGPHDTLGRFVLAANHLPIEYKVTVNPKTGRIEYAEKEHILLDKRLQAVADRIISQMQFHTFSEKSVTGSITLIFCCTGDEIKSLMND